jgi:hypothetical protein
MGPAESEPRHIHDEVTIVAAELDHSPDLLECSYRAPRGGWVCGRLMDCHLRGVDTVQATALTHMTGS